MTAIKASIDPKYITKDHVFENIKKISVKRLVHTSARELIDYTNNTGFLSGTEVFTSIFEPFLFDRYCQLRVNIFQQLGVIGNPNINREDMIDIYKAIKKHFTKTYMHIDFPDPPARIYSEMQDFDVYMTLITSPSSAQRSIMYKEGKSKRSRFFKTVKEDGYTLKHLLSFMKCKKTRCFQTLAHSVVVFEELPEAIEKLKKERTERRKEISRVWMRKTNMNGWAVPTICAFAVQGSKKWDYMLGANEMGHIGFRNSVGIV